MSSRPCFASAVPAIILYRAYPRPRSEIAPRRYKIPSITPQAILQPSTAMSMVPTASRLPDTTLIVHVNESVITSPKRTSDILSTGLRKPFDVGSCFDTSEILREKFYPEKRSCIEHHSVS